MGVGLGLSSLSALSLPPPVYAQHLVYLLYNCTISCCTVAVYSAMSSMCSKWRSPESASPWSSVDVSNRFSKKAWNPHSAMEYGICWFTGTREFQSVLLPPGLRDKKTLTKTEGLGGGPPHSPPPPPVLKENSGCLSAAVAPMLCFGQCHAPPPPPPRGPLVWIMCREGQADTRAIGFP